MDLIPHKVFGWGVARWRCCLKSRILWNHQRRLEIPWGWLGLSVVVTKSGTSWDKRHIYPAFETTQFFGRICHNCNPMPLQYWIRIEDFFLFSKNCVYLATNPVGELLEDTRALSLWNGGSSSPFGMLEGGVGVGVGSWKSGPGLELARHSRS